MADTSANLSVEGFLASYEGDPNGWHGLDDDAKLALFGQAAERMTAAEARVADLEALLGQARAAARDLLALLNPAPGA